MEHGDDCSVIIRQLHHSLVQSGLQLREVGEVLPAEITHQLWLRSVGDPVQYVHGVAALGGDQRTQQADRPGTGDQHVLGLGPRTGGDLIDLEVASDMLEFNLDGIDAPSPRSIER